MKNNFATRPGEDSAENPDGLFAENKKKVQTELKYFRCLDDGTPTSRVSKIVLSFPGQPALGCDTRRGFVTNIEISNI